jgi:hypothetical protein
MDMVERRIREVFATLLSKGAKALERTANELQRASSQLREEPEPTRTDVERVWSEESTEREPDTMIRSTPLRAVPDTPTDEAVDDVADETVADVVDITTDEAVTDTPWTPPVEPPQMPERERLGEVDAAMTTPATVAGPTGDDATPDRIRQIGAGTVNEARAQLGGLTPAELRELREFEVANRNRTTLIAAIDRALILTG